MSNPESEFEITKVGSAEESDLEFTIDWDARLRSRVDDVLRRKEARKVMRAEFAARRLAGKTRGNAERVRRALEREAREAAG